MIRTVKVRLHPTKEQEIKMWQSAGTMRWAYNYTLSKEEENNKNGGKFISNDEIRKEITQLKKTSEYAWLNEVSAQIPKQAVKDACNAYKKFFNKESEKPRYKSRKRSKPSFYNDNVKLKFNGKEFLIEKVGWMEISEPQRITENKFYNPRISHDGKYWYISIGMEIKEERKKEELSGESVGIDLGIKKLAVCSNDQEFRNINKTSTV